MLNQLRTACLVATSTLLTLPAIAWEMEEGKAAPTIQATLPSTISIKSVVSEIHGKNVSITYELSNTAHTPIIATLSTYSEPYQWQGYAADYPALHFPEMKLSLNGSTAKKNVLTYAWLNGQDITKKIRSAGIDPYIVSQAEAAQPISNLEKHRLSGWLKSTAFQVREDVAVPNWLIQQNASWTLRLAAKSVSTLVVEYEARPATRDVALDSSDLNSSVYRHCSNPVRVKQVLASNIDKNTNMVRVSEYVLPLQLGNTPLPAAQVSFGAMLSTKSMVPVGTFSCGPEEASIEGQPDFQSTNAGYKRHLRILSITAPRK